MPTWYSLAASNRFSKSAVQFKNIKKLELVTLDPDDTVQRDVSKPGCAVYLLIDIDLWIKQHTGFVDVMEQKYLFNGDKWCPVREDKATTTTGFSVERWPTTRDYKWMMERVRKWLKRMKL